MRTFFRSGAFPLSLLGLAGILSLTLLAQDARSATPKKVELPTCAAPKTAKKTVTKKAVGDPKARQAAQKGLDFLVRESKSWGDGHQCYGCHVHAVALEAFVVGKHNQYDIGRKPLDRMITAMTTGTGGSRGSNGLSYHNDSLFAPSKAFGGAAFAHYDQFIDTDTRDDLIKTGRELLKFQQPNGSVLTSWTNWPVGAGDTQTTFQAVQTWRQIYARTADDIWLTPIRNAEDHLRHLARTYAKSAPSSIQEMNYAALGLVEAGAGKADKTLVRLRGQILERQNKDGGFAYNANQSSNAFATGQTIYTLRQLGMVDGDRAVKAGTKWLVSNQKGTGGWSSAGSAKAEAMWGVLGLVSIDVLSIDVQGIADGRHVAGKKRILATASDNQGRGVKHVEIRVDDVPVARACGEKLEYTWSTESLSDGMHLVDVVAENAAGKIAKRRMVVYAGDHFLTDVGSRFEGGSTVLSARNVADGRAGEVKVNIFETVMKDGVPTRGKLVRTESLGKETGALNYKWDGKIAKGKEAKSGRYIAELSFNEGKRAVQKVEHLFSHESLKVQQQKYGQVSGQLRWGGGGSANTAVELVDEKGNVVQRTTTTRSGQYRFKNIDKGKYKVRVKKKGFKDEEQEVAAEAGEDVSFSADMAAE
jgi:squalene-hopene/tetraprenyl-beta-curcumene cyclase